MSNKKGPDEVYCRSCGEPIKKKAEICPNCGVANEYTEPKRNDRQSVQNSSTPTSQQNSQKTLNSPSPSGNAATSSPPNEHDPSDFTTKISGQWHYGVGASVALWILGFGMPDPVAGLSFLIAWGLMPVSIYFDSQWMRATTEWNPESIMWIVLSVIPLVNILAGIVYFFRRYNTPQVSPPKTGYSTGQESDDALSRLRERYSRGELTDEEFEQKVEQIVGTEDTETAQMHVRANDSSNKQSSTGKSE